MEKEQTSARARRGGRDGRRMAAHGGCVLLALAACHASTAFCASALPFADGERLVYEIAWPSGLSLGEAEFTARATTKGWSFEAVIKASLPTIDIEGEYRATADAALCSLEFEKKTQRGEEKTHESMAYDQEDHIAHRKTVGGGGESEFSILPCTRDALTFLYLLRQELAQGRIPPPEDVNFGAQYQVVVTYAESIPIDIAGASEMSDRILLEVTGPGSRHSFEIFFGRDSARTPLLMRIPLDMGTFSVRLLR